MRAIYVCKVFTPEFFAKIEAYLDKTEAEHDGKKEIGFRWKQREYLNMYWNGTMVMKDAEKNVEFQEALLQEYGEIAVPQFETKEFEAAETGWQSQARIMWNDKATKIDSIDEIFYYTEKEQEVENADNIK